MHEEQVFHAKADAKVAQIRIALKKRRDLHTKHAARFPRIAAGAPPIPPKMDPRVLQYPANERLQIRVADMVEARMLMTRMTEQEKARVTFILPVMP